MRIEHFIKVLIKRLLFRGGIKPRRVWFGTGRGVVLYLDRRSDLQREIGIAETEVQPLYRRFIRPASTVYDVGAADGDTTIPFAKMAYEGRVIAFEPSPACYNQLKKNMEMNPNLADHIQLVTAFAGDRDGTPPSYLCEGQSERMVKLDTIVRDRIAPPPDLIKIDVDGGEMDVLRGSVETLSRHHPTLIVEVHGMDMEKQCIRFLSEAGFDVRIIKNAWWRAFYPEYRPIGHNRWLLATHP